MGEDNEADLSLADSASAIPHLWEIVVSAFSSSMSELQFAWRFEYMLLSNIISWFQQVVYQ